MTAMFIGAIPVPERDAPAHDATHSSRSPVSAVVAALDAGATTRQAVADVTGLRPDVVDAAVDYLLRTGRARGLDTACTTGGCSASCGQSSSAACRPGR